MNQNGRLVGELANHHSPIRWWPLICLLLFVCLPATSGHPLFNETLEFNSTIENNQDLIELIQQYTTVQPNSTQFIGVVHPVQMTQKEWNRLISRGPLITKVAFKTRPRFSPTYAFITSSSYRKYINELEEKCRTTQDESIADKRVDSLENSYFRWEENQFNNALMRTLFPETSKGDHTRLIESNAIINRIRLDKEMESQCRAQKTHDNWSTKTDERTSFEDHLINLIFQPRYLGEQAQAIIADIESEDEHFDPRHFGNMTFSRKKRAIHPMTRQQMELDLFKTRRLYREYKRRHS